ncbi:type II toxin-antitoxin system RelE/ParE family toxin [Pararhizobium sp.]|uniref:type II toxin-antitoxin system RelE/ParE family toxin n=1 Tax=Pararhizobium sp. TaxID=1977563 RepID=UPI0027232178|nr:type II toxin-antitoxin system RelE/ParE family toxin [Pararhizobium sp.]MDO9416041.1 type II toxin-antitoxin system RelE/ParE family toxin [Pararhizobium sp.]
MQTTLDGAVNGRTKHRSAETIRAGYRKVLTGSHSIFFRVTDDGIIDVIRILHQQMDIEARLTNT